MRVLDDPILRELSRLVFTHPTSSPPQKQRLLKELERLDTELLDARTVPIKLAEATAKAERGKK